MGQQVGNAVASRVEVELVGNLEGIERLVQFARSTIKVVRVFHAAIKVNFHFQKRRRISPRQRKWAVQIPEFLVDRVAKHFCEQLRRQIPRRRAGPHTLGWRSHQCPAMRADRAE